MQKCERNLRLIGCRISRIKKDSGIVVSRRRIFQNEVSEILRSAVPVLDVRRETPRICARSRGINRYSGCRGRVKFAARRGPSRARYTIRPSDCRFSPNVGDAVCLIGSLLVANSSNNQTHVGSLDPNIGKGAEIELNNGARGVPRAAFRSNV